MIIVVTQSGALELRDHESFRAFKIVDESGANSNDLSSALAGIARLAADGNAAWVSPEGLMRLLPAPPSVEWRVAFDNMVGLVAKHGWVHEADGTIRAHIERRAPR